MDKETQEKIQQLQMAEQGMQTILLQKQQFQTQIFEIENALKELETAKEAYKIVGNIMVLNKKENLIKELTEKKETTEIRIKTLEKQEKQIKEKTTDMQKKVMEKLNSEKK